MLEATGISTQEKRWIASPRVVAGICEENVAERMILVDIHRAPGEKTDLYTYQNTEMSRFVDNMVDNVDNALWITHAGFVNNIVS